MDFPIVTIPPNYDRNFFKHQLTSIYNMEKMEKNQNIKINDTYTVDTNIGIQADMTGYGKTASMIGLIMRDEMEWDLENKYMTESFMYMNMHYKITKTNSFDKLNCNLIIVNNSIIKQWENEIKLTNLRYEIINSKKKCNVFGIENVDVILCIPTMFNKFIIENNNYAWKRVIYDEPDTIHIPSMKQIYFGFMWLVSATPYGIKKKYVTRSGSFLPSLDFSSLPDVFFKSLIIKNNDEYVKNSWKLPETTHLYYDCYQPLSQTIKGMVSERIQKMIDADNIKGAIINLGGKESDSIIDLINFKFQEDLTETKQKIERYQNRQDQEMVEEWTNKKNTILKKIDDFKNRYDSFINSSCIICYNELKDPVLFPCCHNIFCGKCIMKWHKTNSSCPLCRTKIEFSKLVYINSGKNENKNKKKDKPLPKIEQIVKIINDKKKGKFIIFSEDDLTFSFIRSSLSANNINCLELKGSISTREKTLVKFKKSKDTISLFLNSKNNGAGINLQECTDIILYHTMSKTVTTQIIGRANRIGRKDKLYIHHLCIDNRV